MRRRQVSKEFKIEAIVPLIIWGGLWFVGMSLPACQTASLTPRLPLYVESSSGPGSQRGLEALGNENISYPIIVGLRLVSDDTAPESGPRLSDSLVEVLQNRVVRRIENDLPRLIRSVTPIGGSLNPGELQQFLSSAQARQVDFVMLAILSGVETEVPTEIGEETVMTRMPGVEVENTALAEIALVDVRTGKLVFQVEGQASESMEQLLVPLASAQEDTHDPYDILRANAGQKALDLALTRFIEEWKRGVAST